MPTDPPTDALSLRAILAISIFCAVYLGMALGRWPRLRTDRTGIALLGGMALLLLAEDRDRLLAEIDVGALAILFGLMVVSAQFDAARAYQVAADRLARFPLSDHALVGGTVLLTGGLSSILANDIIVFAMTPVLCKGLLRSGRNPLPFLLAHAGAANAGSAATLLGNPQNIIIGEHGELEFWRYALEAAPAALLALAAVHVTIMVVWRGRFRLPEAALGQLDTGRSADPAALLDRRALLKALLATAALLALFATGLPRWLAAMTVAALLLISRRQSTKQLLGLVDWHLLALFAGLFVVTGAIGPALEALSLPLAQVVPAEPGLHPLAIASLIGSNTIGNVPFVMLVLSAVPALGPETLTALAVFSTLAGNFLLVGSFANIIVAEQARREGVTVEFRDHARSGIPMTLAGMGAAYLYILLFFSPL